jgi:hypothetical protein
MPPPGGPISDYGAPGPFQTMTMDGSGPDGMYTLVRPATLGENGFPHPIATWGNGITTTPSLYPVLLSTIASHGFVIVASDSSNVTPEMMTQGLDWLIKRTRPVDPVAATSAVRPYSPVHGRHQTGRADAQR